TLNQRVRSSTLRRPIGNIDARVAELADALDLGSSPLDSGWGVKSPLSPWVPLSYCTEGISFASASSPLFCCHLFVSLMKVTIEPLSPVQKKLVFEIPPERVGEEIEKAYRTFQHSARIKGFRAGKAPRPLLERHFGEQVAAEVSSLLVEESYSQ